MRTAEEEKREELKRKREELKGKRNQLQQAERVVEELRDDPEVMRLTELENRLNASNKAYEDACQRYNYCGMYPLQILGGGAVVGGVGGGGYVAYGANLTRNAVCVGVGGGAALGGGVSLLGAKFLQIVLERVHLSAERSAWGAAVSAHREMINSGVDYHIAAENRRSLDLARREIDLLTEQIGTLQAEIRSLWENNVELFMNAENDFFSHVKHYLSNFHFNVTRTDEKEIVITYNNQNNLNREKISDKTICSCQDAIPKLAKLVRNFVLNTAKITAVKRKRPLQLTLTSEEEPQAINIAYVALLEAAARCQEPVQHSRFWTPEFFRQQMHSETNGNEAEMLPLSSEALQCHIM